MKFSTKTVPILLSVLVSACASQPQVVGETNEQRFERRLAESGQKIDEKLVQISRAGGLSGVIKKQSEIKVTGENITVIWSGPAPELLKKIAEAKGLKFAVMGRVLPIPLTLEQVNAPFVQVLENIGVQLGDRADVVLKQDALELRYRAL
ncbi:DotD/TraH family lipoprotein [Herbaspirillum seropedicae]|uniref:DotD/TraH family lipoprotein n=1 Tax=Herbaspirillum seropedicae TaxID=964 RepID=UPI00286240F0|nr:DotD/TraH family lipoprotein [Herbaspirillum seropedicae]MDR6398055.1 hypothetical protein [Herbaspirillum seropedicae]